MRRPDNPLSDQAALLPAILIAEEHARLRQTLHDWLEAVLPGWPIQSVPASAVVAATERWQPDLVLLAFGLPARDGLLSLDELRRRFPQTAVIVLTWYDSTEQQHIILKAGARAVLDQRHLATELLPAILSSRSSDAHQTVLWP